MRQPIPFGKYLLLDRISVGGMAEVFKAKSYGVEGFEKVIAIKRILPSMGEDRDFIKMFIDEAKIAGQLAHANICQIFELGRIEGAHFIAMEYIWGKDLLQIQNRFRKLGQTMPVSMACHIVAKVCEGLDYAHRKRDPLGQPLEIVHRDCSPQNVLVSYEGEVKIIDFGIAKAASRSSRTMAGVLKGKFGYMSPEQVRGLPLDSRSDIFSLGTILYESLTGARLFQGESDFSTLERVRNVSIDPPRSKNRNIPEQVEDIVMRALERDPEERYQHCSEMHADLQQYLMSQEHAYTAKSLGGWLKSGFEGELARERRLMEKYKKMGRDGLIAGKPQAEARLDIVSELGEAGPVEGDPTVLGGPSFDDIIDDGDPSVDALAVAAQMASPVRAGGKQGGDFGEEGPTEIFGEIGDEIGDSSIFDVQDLADHPGMQVEVAQSALSEAKTILGDQMNIKVPPPAPVPGGHSYQVAHPGSAPSSAPGVAVSGPMAQAAAGQPVFMPQGMAQGQGGYRLPLEAGVPSPPGMAALGSDAYFGTTSSVTPLPTPSAMRSLDTTKGTRRRRPSIVKDIAIGVGIAVVVLGIFAGVRFVFLGDKPGTQTAEAAEYGTILVTVRDGQPDDEVWVNGDMRGTLDDGALTIESLAVGDHEVEVRRPGLEGKAGHCAHTITLQANKVEHIKCGFTPPPPTGTLELQGVSADHAVSVDGMPLSSGAAAEPIELAPKVQHAVVVRVGGAVVDEFSLTLEKDQVVHRALARAELPEPPAVDEAAGDEPSGDADGEADEDDGDEHSGESATHHGDDHEDSAVKGGASAASIVSSVTRDRDDHHGRHGDHANDRIDRVKPDEGGGGGEQAADKPAVGHFMAFTTPWAKVYIDGKNTGKMTPIAPRAKIALRPGRHKVTFIVGKEKFDYSIVITAGEDTKLVQDLPVKEKN